MTTTISSKGWVVIPAELRKKYNLNPGRGVVFVDYGGVLSIIPAMDDPVRQAAGMLADDGPSLTQMIIAEHQKEVERE